MSAYESGAQAHIMRCDDDGYYNRNSKIIRTFKILATKCSQHVWQPAAGTCVPQVAVVEVRPSLIAYTRIS